MGFYSEGQFLTLVKQEPVIDMVKGGSDASILLWSNFERKACSISHLGCILAYGLGKKNVVYGCLQYSISVPP